MREEHLAPHKANVLTVVFESMSNSSLVNLDRRFDFPTPESPMMTTVQQRCNQIGWATRLQVVYVLVG